MLSMSRTLGQLTGVSLLGAFFARRLQHYAGKAVDVIEAGNSAIVGALHDQSLLAAGLVAAGLFIALRQAWKEWKQKSAEKAEANAEFLT